MQWGRTREGALALVSQAFRFADQIIEDYESKEPLVEPVAGEARDVRDFLTRHCKYVEQV